MALSASNIVLGDFLLGLLAISLQVAIFAIKGTGFHQAYDVSVGIWGGVILLVTAIFIHSKKLNLMLKAYSVSSKLPSVNWVKVMAVLSIISGLVMVGLYAWRSDQLSQRFVDGKCSYTLVLAKIDFCDEVVISSLFIIDGILAFILNVTIFTQFYSN